MARWGEAGSMNPENVEGKFYRKATPRVARGSDPGAETEGREGNRSSFKRALPFLKAPYGTVLSPMVPARPTEQPNPVPEQRYPR